MLATVRAQYEYMLGSESAARNVNRFFDVALPVSAAAFWAPRRNADL